MEPALVHWSYTDTHSKSPKTQAEEQLAREVAQRVAGAPLLMFPAFCGIVEDGNCHHLSDKLQDVTCPFCLAKAKKLAEKICHVPKQKAWSDIYPTIKYARTCPHCGTYNAHLRIEQGFEPDPGADPALVKAWCSSYSCDKPFFVNAFYLWGDQRPPFMRGPHVYTTEPVTEKIGPLPRMVLEPSRSRPPGLCGANSWSSFPKAQSWPSGIRSTPRRWTRL